MEVLIGVDVGTTATKVITATTEGTVRARASAGYPLHVPTTRSAELDPEELRAAVLDALAQVAQQAAEQGDDVVGLSLSTAMHGLVPLDGSGTARGPVMTWADRRAARQASRLHDDGLARGLHARTGTPVHPMSPLAKLAWWHETEPTVARAVPMWGGIKELLVSLLTGAAGVVDASSASATGLYDTRRKTWDAEALALAAVTADRLPRVVPSTHVVGTLLPEVAEAAGLRAGLPVVIGASDGVLAALGTGAVSPGTASASIGTSAALRLAVTEPVLDESGALFCYSLTEDRWIVGGASNNGGAVVRWAAQAFGADVTAEDVYPQLLDAAAQVPAGSDGLLCLPYLLGERAPWWRGGLRGAYVGLRHDHTRAHLVRAAVEGVCQQLALVHDAMTTTGLAVREVRATGGAMASPLWVQTLAATIDRPVRVSDATEGTALGACLLGLVALGHVAGLSAAEKLVPVRPAVPPDGDAAALYRRTRPLVEQTVRALEPVFAALERP